MYQISLKDNENLSAEIEYKILQILNNLSFIDLSEIYEKENNRTFISALTTFNL